MAQVKDKKQQLDEWFAGAAESVVHITIYDPYKERWIDSGRIPLKELYKMFKLGIELGYEPEE